MDIPRQLVWENIILFIKTLRDIINIYFFDRLEVCYNKIFNEFLIVVLWIIDINFIKTKDPRQLSKFCKTFNFLFVKQKRYISAKIRYTIQAHATVT